MASGLVYCIGIQCGHDREYRKERKMRLPSGECIHCNNVDGDKIINNSKCFKCDVFRKNCDIYDKIGRHAFKRKSIKEIEEECGIRRKEK